MVDKPGADERRQFLRVRKHFIIRFVEKNNLSLKYETSQVENISKGGMCFSSSISFNQGTQLLIQLRTPYIAETVHLLGEVLECKAKIQGILFQNRVRFQDLTPAAKDILEKIEQYSQKG